MNHNIPVAGEGFSIELKDNCATIKVGEYLNRFQCSKEDEETLLHMMNVIANSSGLYGTDIIDFECVFEQCTNHRFVTYSIRESDEDFSFITQSETKAAVLFVVGSNTMGLSDVNKIIKKIVERYSTDAAIIFTAEISEKIDDGYYLLCILE